MARELDPTCVELDGWQIWKNRRFENWHQPFPDIIGPLNGCYDANCPYPYHYDGKSFTDPYARALVDSLSVPQPKLTKNILLQTDCSGLDETHYVTFDHVTMKANGEEELIFQECSVPWKDIRYAALVDNHHIKPFSKQGGQLLFREKLAQITGANIKEVHAAISELDSLNWLEHLPIRMRFPEGSWISRLSHYFDVRIADVFQRDLDFIMRFSPIDVAFTFGIIAQQDRLDSLRSLIPNWAPEKPDELINGLNKFCEWYSKRIPNSEETIADWKGKWTNMFNLEF